jgi:hypothetical protein
MRGFRFIETRGPGKATTAAFTAGLVAPAAPDAVATLRLAPASPPMALRDEVIFLLHTAAEIEHALLAQYLFLAFSLPDNRVLWRGKLMQIAKEEMGHLLSMQNALIALGGPLNFDRQDTPFRVFYPFPLSLEPFSVSCLARFVLAEAPAAEAIPADMGFDSAQVHADAELGAAVLDVRRIGALFDRLIELVGGLDEAADFAQGSEAWQADPVSWQAGFHDMRLAKVRNRSELTVLLREISAQGEGTRAVGLGAKSHFQRLFELYKAAKVESAAHGASSLARPITPNPSVEDDQAPGYLTDPLSRAWGEIFNLRYRWLLLMLQHGLMIEAGQARDELQAWALTEMRRAIAPIARRLVMLPQREGAADGLGAGPPFEMPYTLKLPVRPADLWREHQLIARQSMAQLRKLSTNETLAAALIELDQGRLDWLSTF